MYTIEIVRLDGPVTPFQVTFPSAPTFSTLVQKIHEVSHFYPSKLFYLDEENDIISITSDVELESALEGLYGCTLPRLFFNTSDALPLHLSGQSLDEGSSDEEFTIVEKEKISVIEDEECVIVKKSETVAQSEKMEEKGAKVEEKGEKMEEKGAKVDEEVGKMEEKGANMESDGGDSQNCIITPDEEFELEVDKGINEVVSNFYDGDLQAKFIEFFDNAKNWVITLPSEFKGWRTKLIWMLHQFARAVGSLGITLEILIRSVGWTLETFSSTVLDGLYRDMMKLFPEINSLKVSQRIACPDENTGKDFVDVNDGCNGSNEVENIVPKSNENEIDDKTQSQSPQIEIPSPEIENKIQNEENPPQPEKIEPEIKKAELPEDAALRDLNTLESMGFYNREENIKLLEKHKGDVLACVDEYLSREF